MSWWDRTDEEMNKIVPLLKRPLDQNPLCMKTGRCKCMNGLIRVILAKAAPVCLACQTPGRQACRLDQTLRIA